MLDTILATPSSDIHPELSTSARAESPSRFEREEVQS